MILLLDNYDSFTFNLYQYLGELGAEVEVLRNDKVSVEEALALRPQAVVISPGPGAPREAGITLELVGAARVPLLGVCLGHQAIGEAFGGEIVRGTPVHGKTSIVHHDGRGVFSGIENPCEATRYHSLVVRRETIPSSLEVSAWTEDGTVMGLRHKSLPIEGVQFHPESYLTRVGKDLLRNFLKGIR